MALSVEVQNHVYPRRSVPETQLTDRFRTAGVKVGVAEV
jgi:hypothetical protein